MKLSFALFCCQMCEILAHVPDQKFPLLISKEFEGWCQEPMAMCLFHGKLLGCLAQGQHNLELKGIGSLTWCMLSKSACHWRTLCTLGTPHRCFVASNWLPPSSTSLARSLTSCSSRVMEMIMHVLPWHDCSSMPFASLVFPLPSISMLGTGVHVHSQACPLFVLLFEKDWLNHPVMRPHPSTNVECTIEKACSGTNGEEI